MTTATYFITDGGPYDLDGSANRIIVDPVGIAKPTTSSNPSPLARTGDNALVITRVAGISLFFSVLVAVVYIRKKISL